MGSEGAGLIHILLSLHSNRVTLDWLLSFSQPLWFCLSTGNSFSSFTDTTEVQRGDGSSGMDSIGKGAQRFFFPELVAIVSIVCPRGSSRAVSHLALGEEKHGPSGFLPPCPALVQQHNRSGPDCGAGSLTPARPVGASPTPSPQLVG